MRLLALLVTLVLLACAARPARPAAANAGPPDDAAVPRYAHIFVIMEENKDYGRIIGSDDAPAITALARGYGNAANFYAETHPSEPNYVALVGGSTFGIRDDDAYFCKPGSTSRSCPHSRRPGYVNHTIEGPNLATQLQGAGLTWKAYLESLPEPGSLAVSAGYYASKHAGFVNFASVQRDPQRAQHLVGFTQLERDLHDGRLPNFALVVPNVCNEMHGEMALNAPPGCNVFLQGKLIWRGDRNVRRLVREIQASAAWRSPQNTAIVITFDEDGDGGRPGGGHIPTVVVTNHGPRGVNDETQYTHYSLLRTIEDAFGIHQYLRRAGAPGVVPMTALFRTGAP